MILRSRISPLNLTRFVIDYNTLATTLGSGNVPNV
jgi:hypothetical protein